MKMMPYDDAANVSGSSVALTENENAEKSCLPTLYSANETARV